MTKKILPTPETKEPYKMLYIGFSLQWRHISTLREWPLYFVLLGSFFCTVYSPIKTKGEPLAGR